MSKFIEITPERLRCYGGACPAVFVSSDSALVIGKRAPDFVQSYVERTLGPDYVAIIISREYFEDLWKWAEPFSSRRDRKAA